MACRVIHGREEIAIVLALLRGAAKARRDDAVVRARVAAADPAEPEGVYALHGSAINVGIRLLGWPNWIDGRPLP